MVIVDEATNGSTCKVDIPVSERNVRAVAIAPRFRNAALLLKHFSSPPQVGTSESSTKPVYNSEYLTYDMTITCTHSQVDKDAESTCRTRNRDTFS
jgi:hypothetical protein